MTDHSGASTRIHTIKLWINAFIPASFVGAQPISAGEHAGKRMLTTAWIVNRCFLTDEREFSADLHASSRLHSEIEIDVVKQKMVYEFHHCHETVEIDCLTGVEKCRSHGGTEQMRFENFVAANGGQTFTVDLKASAKNPCLTVASIKVSPNVDLFGTISVLLNWNATEATVRFDGMIETYPAFEMYAAFNGSEAGKPVFQIGVEDGATAASISGPPTRPVNVEVRIGL
jgi:hypothetical protein